MKIIGKFATLVLTLFCFGCGQVTTTSYDTGYVPPKHSTSAAGFEVSQGVGFSTSTTTTTSSTGASSSSDEISSSAATGLAVIGLIALLLIADDVAGCSGSGCSGGSGGGLALSF